jgi:protein tyrosine/serine phosphatase
MAAGTTHERWVDLDGAANVRDLGGLEVAGGGRTASGVLLRADNLQGLSGQDVARLVDEIGVRVVVDLRTGAEVALEGPGPLVADGRVDIRHRSLYTEAGERTDVTVDGLLPWQQRPLEGHEDETPAVRAYLSYLRDRPDSIVDALRDVAHGEAATVVHCAAGKDRTGVVCAFALETVGAERAAIVADYVATGERLVPLLARLRSSPTYADDLDGSPDESHRPRAATMERVLELVDERHGGASAWLERQGFGAGERDALRARLVA